MKSSLKLMLHKEMKCPITAKVKTEILSMKLHAAFVFHKNW